MGSALEKVDYLECGANKKTVEDSFQIIANQARWIEQTLMIQIEDKIKQEFKQKEKERVIIESFIQKVKVEAEDD